MRQGWEPGWLTPGQSLAAAAFSPGVPAPSQAFPELGMSSQGPPPTTLSVLAESPCLQNPCQNDGQCREQGATFTCECEVGYGGDLCMEPRDVPPPRKPGEGIVQGPVPSQPLPGQQPRNDSICIIFTYRMICIIILWYRYCIL